MAPSALVRVARGILRRRRLILVAAVVAFALSGALGGGVASKLSSGGFDDPGAESTRAQDYLDAHFAQGGMPNVILLVTADPGLDVDNPVIASVGQALTDELAHEKGVVFAASYWSTGDAPPLKTTDGKRALVFGRIDGDSNAVNHAMEDIGPKYMRSGNGVTVAVGGFGEVFREVNHTI